MNKKLQVFISSTYTDLQEERQAAVEAILDAGHIPAGMELFKAGKSQMKTIQKWIDESDVYMLILGGRYGSVENESGLSYTELEYKYAISKNMPVFAVVLDDSFLFTKAASKGKDAIFEKDNIKKFDDFKLLVKSNIVKFASNIEQINSVVHSHLNELLNDEDYTLIGWIRANHIDDNYNLMSNESLNRKTSKIIDEIFYRNNKITNIPFTSTVSKQILKFLEPKAILDFSHKVITLEILDDDNNIKVTTATTDKFSYIKNGERYFYLYTETTKQQSENFKIETVQINGIDYTSQVLLSKTNIPNRGQFTYIVQSDFIPPNLESCDLYYVTSYICPALDFFQSRKLTYPCNNFMVSVTLKNDIKNLYTILGSTFSSFSRLQYDDYKASEVHNFNTLSMNLPTWSLPGTGYAITLKVKTEENHI